MSTTIGIIGIIIALIAVNVLVYKGLNNVLAGYVACVIMIFASGANFAEAMTAGIASLGTVLGNMLGILVFGGILGQLYSESNASISLARLIVKPFGKSENGTLRRTGTLFILIVVRVVLGLAGLDNLAILPLMTALVLAVFAGANLPRKYVNCALIVANTIGTLVPGAPHQYVILFQSVVPEFNNNATLFSRWLLLIIYVAACLFLMERMLKKDEAKGLKWDPGPLSIPDVSDESIRCPHWAITFVPVIIVYVTYNFLGSNAWVSLIWGVLAAAVLFYPYFRKEEGKGRFGSVVSHFNAGTFLVNLTICGGMIFSMVMAGLDSFNTLTDIITSIPIPACFGLMLISVLLVGASSAHSAMIIVGSICAAKFIPNGMNVQAAGIIALWTTSVLDSLPSNTGLVMQAEMSAIPMSEGYPSIFKTTVVATFCMCILACIFSLVGLI